jgi:rubrerythrin
MDKNFSATDIVEIAIEIEKNGMAFYKAFAKKAKDNALSDFFSDMADEESVHVKDFSGILSSVAGYEPCQVYPQEYFFYLNAIAGGYIFKDNSEFREKTDNIDSKKDAIDFSLGIEKNSILLYEEMKKMVPEKDKKLIESIITQEKQHVKKLWDLKNTRG